MLTIKEKIQADKIWAMKNSPKTNILLGTVLGELDRISKNPTDDESINVIKKMIESCIECKNMDEAFFLERYMPKSLTIEELSINIQDYCIKNSITEKRQMGLVMKYLKENFNGRYDGKLASQIISNILK